MCGDRPKEWIYFLSLVKRLFNTNFHSSTYLTPYEVVYGQHPTLFIPYFPQGYMTEVVDIILQRMEETIRLFKHHTSILIWRMKKKSEKRDLKGCFRLVIWFTWSYNLTDNCRDQACHKLGPMYYEPFPVLTIFGQVSCHKEKPPHTRILHILHVSQLKNKIGSNLVGQQQCSTRTWGYYWSEGHSKTLAIYRRKS